MRLICPPKLDWPLLREGDTGITQWGLQNQQAHIHVGATDSFRDIVRHHLGDDEGSYDDITDDEDD